MAYALAQLDMGHYWFSVRSCPKAAVRRVRNHQPISISPPCMNAPSLTQELESLMADHERELLAYAARLLRSPHLAQDMVQDAFLKFISARRDNKEIANARAWLYRVTHNLCLDYIRRNRRGEEHMAQQAELIAPAPQPAPDANLKKADNAIIAEQLLDTLSEREQEIVRLKIYAGRSYKEISDILSITTGNVGFILHTAMKKLARHARQEGLLS